MKQIVCEMCGGHDFAKVDGMMVCQSCGTKFTVEEAKKMMIEGPVDVSGSTVKIDKSSELENLYEIARRARNDGNHENAVSYYEKVLALDPNSWEATYFILLERGYQTTIGNIRNAVVRVNNTLDTCLDLIKKHVTEKGQIIEAIHTMGATLCSFCSAMANAAVNHYNGIDYQIQANYRGECIGRVDACALARKYFADLLEDGFQEYREDLKDCISGGWKDCITYSLKTWNIANQQNKEIVVNRVNALALKIKKLNPAYRAPEFKKGLFGWKLIKE